VETENTDKEVIRSSSGQFVKGASGNPKGRPKGAKNRITELKEAAELALREAVDPETIKRIFQSMAAEALDGNVQAAKLILDKFVTNAKVEQERGEENPEIVIKIKNLSNAPVEIEEAEIIEHEDPTSG
jgi:hypothetical protein